MLTFVDFSVAKGVFQHAFKSNRCHIDPLSAIAPYFRINENLQQNAPIFWLPLYANSLNIHQSEREVRCTLIREISVEAQMSCSFVK